MVPPYLRRGPPVLQHPERVVPMSEYERFEPHFQPNVALAPLATAAASTLPPVPQPLPNGSSIICSPLHEHQPDSRRHEATTYGPVLLEPLTTAEQLTEENKKATVGPKKQSFNPIVSVKIERTTSPCPETHSEEESIAAVISSAVCGYEKLMHLIFKSREQLGEGKDNKLLRLEYWYKLLKLPKFVYSYLSDALIFVRLFLSEHLLS